MFGALSVAKVPMPEVARVNETFPLLASGKLLDGMYWSTVWAVAFGIHSGMNSHLWR